MAALICGRRAFTMRNSLLKIPKRNHDQGYIVLLPEIGEDLPEKYPLLKEDTLLPIFNPISVEKCIAATGKQSVESEMGLKAIEKTAEGLNADFFKDVVEPLEKLDIPLQTTMGISRLLYMGKQSLMPTSVFNGIQKRGLSALGLKYTSKPIYELCKKKNEDSSDFSDEQKRIIDLFLYEGRGNGLELTGKDFDQHYYLLTHMYHKIQEFRDKLAIAQNMFKHKVTDPNLMREFPETFLKHVADDVSQYKTGPWTITLRSQIDKTFMEYCPDSLLRWNIWHAGVLVCSKFGDEALETSSLVNGITTDKCEIARNLGFKHWSEMSMRNKMAGNLETVYNFLYNLRDRAYPRQVEEIRELDAFAQKHGHIGRFEQWDVPYWARRQKAALYKYDEEVLKEYFSLPHVLDCLFKLLKNLFNVEIVERNDVDVWYKDVKFFDVYDLDVSKSEPVGSFYFQPHNLNGIPYVDEGYCLSVRHKSKICGVKPLTSIVIPLPQPGADGTPSLMTLKSVQALFEHFGEALQQLLTRTNYALVSGSAGVEWDAVLTSKYLMGHFLYEPHVLKSIGRHYKTNEPLSDELIENLKKSRTHMSAYNLCWELYLCRFDLDLHAVRKVWERIMKPLWKEHFVFPEDKRDSHVCSWNALFVHELGGQYYCFLWSKMLAADVYSAFQESQATDAESLRKIGQRFKDTFLISGGSKSPSEIFRRFRGRDPSYESFIRSLRL